MPPLEIVRSGVLRRGVVRHMPQHSSATRPLLPSAVYAGARRRRPTPTAFPGGRYPSIILDQRVAPFQLGIPRSIGARRRATSGAHTRARRTTAHAAHAPPPQGRRGALLPDSQHESRVAQSQLAAPRGLYWHNFAHAQMYSIMAPTWRAEAVGATTLGFQGTLCQALQ